MAMFRTLCVVLAVSCFVKRSHSQQNVCGMATLNTKIVGGQNSSPGSWPWQVSLQQSGSHFCGGSLINNNWVLSAAHCFPGTVAADVTVYLGLQTLAGVNSNQQSRSVNQIIVHSKYSSTTKQNDIALLQLSQSVTFTDYINSICLATAGSTFFNNTNVWVTGWGNIANEVHLPSPGKLQEVEVPIIGNRQCNCLYIPVHYNIYAGMICAGLLTGGKDSCQGDSGGPLVVKQGSRWIQAGIVSFGNECAQANFPGVYTRVSEYQDWINSMITTNQPGYLQYNSNGTDADLQYPCNSVPHITSPPTTTSPPVACGIATLNNVSAMGSPLASAGEFPWMASLQHNGSQICGGTLIAEQYVMSSADCFTGTPNASEWTVVLGSLSINGSSTTSVQVQEIQLSSGNGKNIAVLKLSVKPSISDFIRPICVDMGGINYTIDTQCWAAGWDSKDQPLKQFNTTIASCGNSSSSNSICIIAMPLTQGDKGGALMCNIQNSWIHAAVLTVDSSSNKSMRSTEIQTLTKTSSFSSFLKSVVPSLSTSTSTTPGASSKVFSFQIVALIFLMSVLAQISISE